MKDRFLLRVVIEILGSPKEHVEKTMGMVIEKFKEEYDVKKEKLHKAEQIKQFWNTFVEFEVEIDKIEKIIDISFNYLPSSIEVIEPSHINIKNQEFSNIFNDLLAKLHNYDMFLKNLRAENVLLKKQIKE